ERGYAIGLVTKEVYERFLKKKELLNRELQRLKRERVKPSAGLNALLSSRGTSTLTENIALDKLLKRPEIKYSVIKELSPSPEILTAEIEALVEIRVKYEGYVQKQIELAGRFNKFESKKIPPAFEYTSIPGLSKEVIEKLREVQPETIGQAGRIPGITPAAVSILLVAVERFW